MLRLMGRVTICIAPLTGKHKMSKLVKVPKQNFTRYKNEVLRQVARLGLTDWKIDFKFKDMHDDNLQACLWCNYKKRNACFGYTSVTYDDNFSEEQPEVAAKHEVAHLLTAELLYLGECRYMDDSELEIADEKLAVILSKVL